MSRARAVGAALIALAAAPGLAQEPALTEGHLAIVDLDADGAVSLDEYRVYTSNAFIALDRDADGALAPAEAAGVISEALFAAADGDGDGVLSRAEYDAQVLADFRASDGDGSGALD
jgi:hypothetical protein